MSLICPHKKALVLHLSFAVSAHIQHCYCSMFRGISARRSGSAGPLRSRSGLRRMRIMASGHGRCASWCIGIVARSLGAGGRSGRTTWSRKVTSAPSTSSNPCYGTSTSCVTAKPCVFGISWSCMKWCCLILFMTFWSKTDRALMRPALHFLLGYKLTMEL